MDLNELKETIENAMALIEASAKTLTHAGRLILFGVYDEIAKELKKDDENKA